PGGRRPAALEGAGRDHQRQCHGGGRRGAEPYPERERHGAVAVGPREGDGKWIRAWAALPGCMAARSRAASVGECVMHDVDRRAQGGLALVRGIVMDLLVLKAVSQVAIEAKEYNQPSVVDNAEPLGRAPIVLMNLRQSAGEIVKLVKNR